MVEVSSRLGPILNLGDLAAKPQQSQNNENPEASNKQSVMQKYTSLSSSSEEPNFRTLINDSLNRESTAMSVSNVGMKNISRSATQEKIN